jgi:hypothetical protein
MIAAMFRAAVPPGVTTLCAGLLAGLLAAPARAADSAASSIVTYTKDIAPILLKNCADCHRPGEIGPFSLLSYEDAQKRADFLAEIAGSRRMPPWNPRRAPLDRSRD